MAFAGMASVGFTAGYPGYAYFVVLLYHGVLGRYLETPSPSYNHKPWLRTDIPNPRKDTWGCGRQARHSWICDPDHLLSLDEADSIDRAVEVFREGTGNGFCNCKNPDDCRRTPGLLNSQASQNTTNLDSIYGGWQPGVLLITEVNLHSEKSEGSTEELLREYAHYVRQKVWNFGVCEDDFLILISIKQGLVYTDIGDNLAKKLPQYCAQRIFEKNKQWFRDDDYAGAITGILQMYANVVNGQMKCHHSISISIYVITSTMSLLFVIILIFIRRKIRQVCEDWCAKCEKRKCQRNHESEEDSEDKDYSSYEESSCGLSGNEWESSYVLSSSSYASTTSLAS